MQWARYAAVWTAFLALVTGHAMSAEEITVAQLKDLRMEPRKIVYKTVDDVKLQVHVYAAEGAAPGDKRPAILMIHGGGWENPGPFHMAPHCRYFALRGLVAVNVEYRLVKKDSAVRIPDCVADCRDALRWVRRKAADLGIDPDRIAVAGDSAGGHLAAALGLLPDPEEGKPGVVSSRPSAMVLYNPVVDLAALKWMPGHAGVAPLAASPKGETWEDRASRVSPIRYVRKGLPPTLLVHGDKDGCVPVEQADRFAKLMEDAGNAIQYKRMAGWDHAFAIPGCGTDAQVAEALRLTDRFLTGLGYLKGEATIQREPARPEAAPPKRRTDAMKALWNCLPWLLLPLVGPATLSAETAIGDWGHFVLNHPRIFLNNPEGKAFTVTIHVMGWPPSDWNKPDLQVLLTGPDGKAVVDGPREVEDGECVVKVPTGAKGVYRLQVDGVLWVSSSLDESVLWTGDPSKRHNFRERFAPAFQMVVPRQWWFWVPEGVTRFTCKVQRSSEYMSQREDWGIFIITPRGQRIRALWGQPPLTPAADYLQDMTAEVEVEPGAGGRFWSVEMRYGDSHNYSKPNLCFDGVPPYIARSPEEWFDPDTGRKPRMKVYDDEPFIQSARIEDVMRERWPNLQHFSPCPSLGDPDGVEVLGDARFALWNPEGRDLRFRIGTYLPRKGVKDPEMAQVRIVGPDGKAVFEKALPMLHIHEADGQPTDTLKTGPGVSVVSVTGPERWFSFTYPATPVVLLGQDAADGWRRFRFTAGTARNWYFFVPKGTREFAVRAAAADKDDVMHFEICSPDRTLALIYDNAGEKAVKVPDGLDGKIWHLRPDVGSATRIVAKPGPDCRYQEMRLTVDLKGIPGGLAPTWEQWFDPARPTPSEKRR